MDVESSKHDKLDSMLQYQSLGPHKLPLEDLRNITNNFSEERLLGEGGFGKVYKGVLHSGYMVDVKRLMSTMPGIQDVQFENEVNHLMRLKHPNIVQLLGYSSEIESILTEYNGRYVYAEKSEKLLCLEYLPNGSLHGHLSDESSGLDWVTRYKILEGICNGLHYLQEKGQVSPIIHMDLKPTNILLDDNMVPKIADFGLSRLFGAEKTRTRTLNCHGTLGYMPPEYVERGIITKKLDIFSLGVIIIEIMTGRKDYPEEPGTSSQEFSELVLKNWRNRLEKAPGYTSRQIDCLQIRRCIQIGLMCVERDRMKRPTIQQIIRMLHIPVLEMDYVMKFEEVITPLEQALLGFAFSKPNISDEAREQVEFIHAQLKSAKEWVYMPDDGFYNDMPSLDNNNYDPRIDPAMHKMLSQKLNLKTITYLTRVSLALHEMVASNGGQDPGGRIEKMSMLLKKIKDFVQTQNPEIGGPPIASKLLLLDFNGEPVTIPDDFRCPISLELMKDPVIVVTGQTYERACIEKWLASGHHTCPTTQQRMANTTLTPNYVLRNLIAQWCKANGIEPPKPSACSSSERANIDALLSKLCSPDPEEQRSAAAEFRLLAKRNANNRICIAEAGAIPLLSSLLSSSDLRTQEHAVTALLNLSIHEDNKGSIISSGAVPGIVHVLKKGSMEARENAAATLFSLSVIDEYKVTIGGTGAIPALVVLLSEGSQRGKKDAAAALFNLCIYQGNKSRAIRAGLVPLIMKLVTNPAATGHLVDEAMAILSILSSHPEGKAAIGTAEPIPVLVEMIGSGTPRNRENAAAVMLQLCCVEKHLVHLARAHECGIMVPLRELALNGTERAMRKAVQLLERICRFLVQQQEEQEASSLAPSQDAEQVQEADIPEQLESPTLLFPPVG